MARTPYLQFGKKVKYAYQEFPHPEQSNSKEDTANNKQNKREIWKISFKLAPIIRERENTC